jgi:thiaminase
MNTTFFVQRHAEILAQVVNHRFYTSMIAGNLPHTCLAAYLTQDEFYLERFADVLRSLEVRLSDPVDRETLQTHETQAANLIPVQRAFICRLGDASEERCLTPWGVTSTYCKHLVNSIRISALAGLTSILPCYLTYRDAVQRLHHEGSRDPLYQSWISSLPTDDANSQWTAQIAEIIDRTVDSGLSAADLDVVFDRSTSFEIGLLDKALASS